MISLVSYHEEPIFSCFLLRYVLSFVVPLVCFCYSLHSGGRHLEFRKKMSNSGLDKDICSKFYEKMRHGHAEMTRDQKSKPKVNSRDDIKRMSATWVRCSHGLQKLSAYRSLF